MRDWQEHWELAERLKATRCQWILSSYDVPETRKLYPGYHIIAVQSFSGMRVKKTNTERLLNEEVLITNFTPGIEYSNAASSPEQIKLQLEEATHPL